jgi:uncharacterized protein involved in exopolysaccharide biosynthesis
MPDLVIVFAKNLKFIFGFTVVATVIALVAALLSPKKYLSTATALPANSVMADKARIFNSNIEALYSEFGSPDELDRLEGTAMLDTIFIAAAKDLNLVTHYLISRSADSVHKAAMKLKNNSKISRSAYGELKIKVWDKDPNMAAILANTLLQKIRELHQHLQTETNSFILQKLEEDYRIKQQQFRQIADSVNRASGADAEIIQAKKNALLEQIQQYEKMTDQYRLALTTNPQILLTVENARPSLKPDKPKLLQTVLFIFFGAFLFSFLTSLFIESRKTAS